jgi:hypothetical protein
MGIKVKEIQDDAIIEIKVNKNFYLMIKAAMFYVFKQEPDNQKKEEMVKKVLDQDMREFTELEAAFKTLTLLIAEIERVALAENKMVDKEIELPDLPKDPTQES